MKDEVTPIGFTETNLYVYSVVMLFIYQLGPLNHDNYKYNCFNECNMDANYYKLKPILYADVHEFSQFEMPKTVYQSMRITVLTLIVRVLLKIEGPS